jgi:hypothetical protein
LGEGSVDKGVRRAFPPVLSQFKERIMLIRSLRAAVFASLGGLVAGSLFAQDLSDASFGKWKDYILTKPEELTWKVAIGWEQNLGQGILRSIKGDKPILLWVEAGDPQGCV